MVIHREERQSFAHFLTSTCAIVGGILTMASLIDSFVYAGRNRLKQGGVKQGLGMAAAQGKFL
jgi:endoplasmic reticulum-Golgi intermediate compartment protein 3